MAQQNQVTVETLPLSSARVPVLGETSREIVSTTIHWEGDEYFARDGTLILMEVIRDPTADKMLRAKALNVLSRLRNTDITPLLVSLYQKLPTRDCKGGVLVCLIKSADPRALPLFVKVVDEDQNIVLRLAAACGLANWNVRSGVTELLHLLECATTKPDCRVVRDQAANTFRDLNLHKAWGCPEEEIRLSLKQKNNLSQEEFTVLYIQEIKTWFEANKLRFPEWNIGDPLPKIAKDDAEK